MNQTAGYMEHQKAARPKNEQQQGNDEKGSESHLRLPILTPYMGEWGAPHIGKSL
jgi:hypothetical protein